MLLKLTMHYFGKFREKTVEFTEGLNVIRGNSEQGKSTMLNALGYALCGSRFLPLGLDDYVTWGESVKSPKVVLEFVADEHLTLTRSKSGAEIVGKSGLRVSGQAEVTAYIERIFGADLLILQAVAFARQDDIRGALGSNSTPLIEKLSKVGVLDEIVTKISEKLPSGNTKALELMLSSKEAGLVEPPKPDLDGMSVELAALTQKHDELQLELSEALNNKLYAEEAAKAAEKRITQFNYEKNLKVTLERDLQNLKDRLETLPCYEGFISDSEYYNLMAANIAAYEAAARKQSSAKTMLNVYNTVSRYARHSYFVTNQSKESFLASLEEDENLLKKHRAEIVWKQREESFAQAALITESACGLCGKELQNVPEVVEKNDATRAKLEIIQDSLKVLNGKAASLEALIDKQKQDKSTGEEVDSIIVNFGDNLEVSAGWPKRIKWKGEVPNTDDKEDYDALVKQATQEVEKSRRAQADKTGLQQRITLLTKQLESLNLEPVDTDIEVVAKAAQVFKALEDVKARHMESLQGLVAFNNQIQSSKDLYNLAYTNYLEGQKDVAVIKKNIAVMSDNNALIKKLREIRPVVGAQLWGNLLSSVSRVFSQIRGSESRVAKSEKGFTVDGKPSELLSGSTKDSLGIAIRAVLQATFLPAMPVLILDEPAAAMDDSREAALLAALSGLGLKQILMVTHSSVADAYANSLIQL